MLQVCERSADQHNIKFSTDLDPAKSKSKAIFMVGKKTGLQKPVPLQLCGRELPWVDRADPLGHILHESGTLQLDIRAKRAAFISASVDIRDTFSFAHPLEQLQAVQKYCTSMYGSNLWRLESDLAAQVHSAWVTGVKLAWEVPRATRSYLVQEVLAPGFTPLRSELLLRFRNFFRRLLCSPSPEVVIAALLGARDIRTTVGANLQLLKEETGLDTWQASPGEIRRKLKEKSEVKVPDQDMWRIPYLRKLLQARLEASYKGQEEKVEELTNRVNSLFIG